MEEEESVESTKEVVAADAALGGGESLGVGWLTAGVSLCVFVISSSSGCSFLSSTLGLARTCNTSAPLCDWPRGLDEVGEMGCNRRDGRLALRGDGRAEPLSLLPLTGTPAALAAALLWPSEGKSPIPPTHSHSGKHDSTERQLAEQCTR